MTNEQVTPGCGVPPEQIGSGAGRPALLWIGSSRPAHLGRSFRLDRDEVTIGRASDADLAVDDPGASRRHARVERGPDGEYVIADLGSRNGTYVNGLKVRSTPLREGDKIQLGTVTAFRFSFREELEEREDRLQRAMRATGVGAFEWSFETGDVLLSGGAERLAPDPRGFWAAVHPEDRERLRELLAAAAAEGRRVEVECRVNGPSGLRWYAMRGEPFRSASGRVTHVAGSIIDVTARKLAEAEVRRQALLFESLLDAVTVLDFQGQIIDWNGRAEAMFGWTKAEALGKRPGDLLFRGGGDDLATTLVASVSQDGRVTNEVTLRRKDGTEVVAEVVGVPLRDPSGRHVADIAIYRDVTERRQMQARLLLADRMAALGTLAAGVAHEINNPLAFVLGNLVYLEEELPRRAPESTGLPEFASALKEARTGAERIRSTVRDLLDLARGRDAEVVAEVDVNAVVEFTVKMAEPQLRHRARIVKRLGTIPQVAAPESRLGQVFLNLLINAAQAIPEGDAGRNEVRVTTRHDPQAGTVTVEVSDTGVGIAAEDRQRIFDPFYTTKTVGVGTGLGLSISHSIVASLGGEIVVESARGKGSTFRVILPASAATPASAVEAERPALPRARILVVDDEPLVGNVLQRLLGGRHEVVVATRGAEALVLLGAGARFDLLLCDLLMPEMSGMELYEKLAAEFPDQARHTVFMTGGAFTDRARAFAARRQHRVMTKPVDLRELEGILAEHLGVAKPAGREGEGKP
ncbi:MAG TPA: PAS domain S-box protein [Anaeromyxobacteraceae bacterium]|nr:PAS domain S-box protein [Anaeromyxobacteraceae bacterium]